MITERGSAGKSARVMEFRRHVIRAGLGLAVLAAGMVFFQVVPQIGKLEGLSKLIPLAVALLILKFSVDALAAKGKKVRKRERQAARGAKGEENVAHILKSLPGDWAIYHDVNTGRGDIDHVLVSPTKGVFLLETKSHGGKVTPAPDGKNILVNGKPPEKDFIAQCHRNTYWLKNALRLSTGTEPWITSVLVFSNAFVGVRKPIRGVNVVNRGYLSRFLEKCPDRGEAPVLWDRRQALDRAFRTGYNDHGFADSGHNYQD